MTSFTANGNTYSDDRTAAKDMNDGGFRSHLLPMLGDAMVDMTAKQSAAGNSATDAADSAEAAALSAATALSAPGANSTSTSTAAISAPGASVSLTVQADKALVPGMSIIAAVTASPQVNRMHGTISAYNSASGVLQFTVDYAEGSGTHSAWTVSLSAPTGVPGVTGNALKLLRVNPAGSALEYVPSPGSGSNIQTLVEGQKLTLTAVSGAVQQLTPTGPGASVQFPAANTVLASVAAAYVANQSSSYQLGIRDGTGTLKIAMPATAALQFALADTSTVAGQWIYPTGADDGTLLVKEMALPSGYLPKTWELNIPEHSSKTVTWYVVLSATLCVGLISNGTITQLIAFNPTTGAIGASVAVSSTTTNALFRLEALSATTVALFFIENVNVSNSARIVGCVATVNAGTLGISIGTAANTSAPADGMSDLLHLKLSGGPIVLPFKNTTGGIEGSCGIVAAVVSGTTVTFGAFGPFFGQLYSLPSIYEIGPTSFTHASNQNGANTTVYTHSVDASTGAITLNNSVMCITGVNNSPAGLAFMTPLPGTNRWLVVATGAPNTNQTRYANVVNISGGAVSLVLGGSAGNYVQCGQSTAAKRLRMAAYSWTKVIFPGYDAYGVTFHAVTDNNNGTLAHLSAGVIGAGYAGGTEVRAPTGSEGYVQFHEGSNAFRITKVTYNGASFSTAIVHSFPGDPNYGAPTAYFPYPNGGHYLLVNEAHLMNKHRGRLCVSRPVVATARLATRAIKYLDDIGGPYLIGTDAVTGHILLLEVAQ